MEPEFQEQHRVSQVYLKQFGYQSEGEWYIHTYQKGKADSIELISKFTAETNIFDLPYQDFKLRRHYEKTIGIVENEYRRVISNIQNQKRLIAKDREILCHFISTLIARSKPHQSFLKGVLEVPEWKEKLINEITSLTKNYSRAKEYINHVPKELEVNATIGFVTNHFIKAFLNFQFIIVKSIPKENWMTSDNPVIIDRKIDTNLIGVNTEIYFPLSRELLLFMYHNKSTNKDNPIISLKIDRVNSINEKIFESTLEKIIINESEYVIIPIP